MGKDACGIAIFIIQHMEDKCREVMVQLYEIILPSVVLVTARSKEHECTGAGGEDIQEDIRGIERFTNEERWGRLDLFPLKRRKHLT